MRCVISQRYSKMKAIHNVKKFIIKFLKVVSYLKDTQKWKQFTTLFKHKNSLILLCHISKILKNESNSQPLSNGYIRSIRCVISQRYSKMKAIHNNQEMVVLSKSVVSYLKDTQKWKQFTTFWFCCRTCQPLCHISKILKNESNSQQFRMLHFYKIRCVISQRYSKMKAIHNPIRVTEYFHLVVSYLKDTQKWKQFTTTINVVYIDNKLCHISKILKNESNSQHSNALCLFTFRCVISQRYSKMKAIHNPQKGHVLISIVVSYLKDTQKWKQFTTLWIRSLLCSKLCHISKILKNESNSQPSTLISISWSRCVISQRYSKMKAIHNTFDIQVNYYSVVSYLKDTQKWKQFTTLKRVTI